MGSKGVATIAILLSFNLIFFTTLTFAQSQPPANCPVGDLSVCVRLLDVQIGTPQTTPCCSLISGLADVEAAACICTALRANVLGIVNVDLNIPLQIVLNSCGRDMPNGFVCHS